MFCTENVKVQSRKVVGFKGLEGSGDSGKQAM